MSAGEDGGWLSIFLLFIDATVVARNQDLSQ